jgi:hypothetical protein
MAPLFCYFQGYSYPNAGLGIPLYCRFKGQGVPMLDGSPYRADDGREVPAVAYLLEAQWGGCTVRTTTKESRHSKRYIQIVWKGGETVPIKWSAVKVCKAIGEVERQINLADAFLIEAKAKAEAARRIANLPQYVDQRLIHLINDIERINNVRNAIDAVRKSIPDGAMEVEREYLKNGNQQSLI